MDALTPIGAQSHPAPAAAQPPVVRAATPSDTTSSKPASATPTRDTTTETGSLPALPAAVQRTHLHAPPPPTLMTLEEMSALLALTTQGPPQTT
ncbi:MAG: hypothetical protein JWM02_845 [Frankiales bacterium]|nr:hypothetical protein [Frankiales bacterium]